MLLAMVKGLLTAKGELLVAMSKPLETVVPPL